MPTGYTAKLHNGEEQTFPEFVMSCARAFGALITMRDDPADAEIPDEFKPSDYHVRELEKARERLSEVEGWTFDQVSSAAEEDFQKRLRYWRELCTTKAARQARYAAMLRQVGQWTPPTEEHVELKKFMLDQLQTSIDFDCNYALKQAVPEHVSPELYRQQRIEKAQRDIAYHEKEQAGEAERARNRTAWVRALRSSLGPVGTAGRTGEKE